MKMRKKITNAQLQTELVEILKNMFLPSKKMIKEQIEWLIEHKYMRRDEDNINMFIYMAWSVSVTTATNTTTNHMHLPALVYPGWEIEGHTPVTSWTPCCHTLTLICHGLGIIPGLWCGWMAMLGMSMGEGWGWNLAWGLSGLGVFFNFPFQGSRGGEEFWSWWRRWWRRRRSF